MNKLIAVLLASSVAVAVPAAAFAQTWTDFEAAVQLSDTGNFGSDIGTMLMTYGASSAVKIVDVTTIKGAPDNDPASHVSAALSTTGEALFDLHQAVHANKFLLDQLAAKGFGENDVVSIGQTWDGTLTLYVEKAQ